MVKLRSVGGLCVIRENVHDLYCAAGGNTLNRVSIHRSAFQDRHQIVEGFWLLSTYPSVGQKYRQKQVQLFHALRKPYLALQWWKGYSPRRRMKRRQGCRRRMCTESCRLQRL